MPSDDSSEKPIKRVSLKDFRRQANKKPDYRYWCSLSFWHLDEAACLLNDLNPEYYKNDPLGRPENFYLFHGNVKRIYTMLNRAYFDEDEDLRSKIDDAYIRNVKPAVKPIILIEWAKRKRLPIPDQLTEQFDGLNNPIVEPVQNIKNKSSTKSKKTLTKTQQRVLELSPQWQEYIRSWLEVDPKLTIARAIRRLNRSKLALDPSGEPYSDGTIRKYIRNVFPKDRRKPGAYKK